MDATKKKLAVGAVAVAALAGGGAAIAGRVGCRLERERPAILDDAAKKLGVEPEALENALKDAFAAQARRGGRGRAPDGGAGDRAEGAAEGRDTPLFGAQGPGHRRSASTADSCSMRPRRTWA